MRTRANHAGHSIGGDTGVAAMSPACIRFVNYVIDCVDSMTCYFFPAGKAEGVAAMMLHSLHPDKHTTESAVYIYVGRAQHQVLDVPVLTTGRDLRVTVDSWSR